jgi:hypothetical protein
MAPNNKISSVKMHDKKKLEDSETFFRVEELEQNDELPFTYNYTFLNATSCKLQLNFTQ